MNTQEDKQSPQMDGTQMQSASVGRTLREAREQLGLSVADVANRIKFAPRQIEWLEDDDFTRLPEAAFVRGFVRGYARLLELDPVQLLSALPAAYVQKAASAQEVKSVEIPLPNALSFSTRRHNIIWLAAALLIAVTLAIFERTHDRAPAENKTVAKTTIEPVELPSGDVDSASAPLAEQAAPPIAEPAQVTARVVPSPVTHQREPRIAPVVVPQQQAAPVQAMKRPVPPVQQAAPQPVPVVTSRPEVKEKETRSATAPLPWQPLPQSTASRRVQEEQQATSDKPAAESDETSVAEHALRIEFDEDAWLEIKDGNDKILISKMYKAGSLVRAKGLSPMLVTLGNARAVRLFDNGKQIKLVPSRTSEVARVKLK